MGLLDFLNAGVGYLTLSPTNSRSSNYALALKVAMAFVVIVCLLVGSAFGEYGDTSGAANVLLVATTLVAVPALLIAYMVRDASAHRLVNVTIYLVFVGQALLWATAFGLIAHEIKVGKPLCASCSLNPEEAAKGWEAAAAFFCSWIWGILAHHNYRVRHGHQAVEAAGVGQPVSFAGGAAPDADGLTGTSGTPAGSGSFLGFPSLAQFVLVLTSCFFTLLGALLLFMGAAALSSQYADFLTPSLLGGLVAFGFVLFAFGAMGLRVLTAKHGSGRASRAAVPFMVGCVVGIVGCAVLGGNMLKLQGESAAFASPVWTPENSAHPVVTELRHTFTGLYRDLGCHATFDDGQVSGTQCDPEGGSAAEQFMGLTLKCHVWFHKQLPAAQATSTACANDGGARDQETLSSDAPDFAAQVTFCQCRGTLVEQVARYSRLIATVSFVMLAMLLLSLVAACDNHRRGAYTEIKEKA